MNYVDDEFFGDTTTGRDLLTGDDLKRLRAWQSELRRSGVTKSLFAITKEEGILDEGLMDEMEADAGKMPVNRIPGFAVIEKIGEGGMGAVYRATQISLGKTVALKVLSRKLSANRQFVERFIREAKALARLNHKNVVSVIDAGESDGVYFFVMEYVDGPTCADVVHAGGPMSEEKALDVALQVAGALEHAAKNGLVHRDIKPDNIMLTSEGAAKLCDLGLVKTADGGAKLTVEGIAMGTPHYISPEQARGKEDIDIRTDIYSLGITLYYLITGHLPFKGGTPGEIMRRHISQKFVIPEEHVHKISDALRKIILKMVQKDPRARYQTPGELREDLELVKMGQEPRRAVPDPLYSDSDADESVSKGRSRSFIVGAGISAAVLAASVALFLAFRGGAGKPPLPDALDALENAAVTPQGGRADADSATGRAESNAAIENLKRKRAAGFLAQARELAGRKDLLLEDIAASLDALVKTMPENLFNDAEKKEYAGIAQGIATAITKEDKKTENLLNEALRAAKERRSREAIELVAEAVVDSRTRRGASSAKRAEAKVPAVVGEEFMKARADALRFVKNRAFDDAAGVLKPFASCGVKVLENSASYDLAALEIMRRELDKREEIREEGEKAASEIRTELEKDAESLYAEAGKLLDEKEYLKAADAYLGLLERFGRTEFVKSRRAEIEEVRPRRGLVRTVTHKGKVIEVVETPANGTGETVFYSCPEIADEITVEWEGFILLDKNFKARIIAFTQGKPTFRIGSIKIAKWKAMSGLEGALESKTVSLSKKSASMSVEIKVVLEKTNEKRVVFGK